MALPLRPGSILDGRYEVIDTLARGGYAAVLRGRQMSTGQDVAIKLLLADELMAAQLEVQRARFEREMALIGRLQHPNIVRLIDSGTLPGGDNYTVLEHVQGKDLATWLAEHGPPSPPEAAHLMTQVLDALSCAHALGVVHRDLKPNNIMVTTTSARRNAMVLDFGIAGIVETSRDESYEHLTMRGTIMGSPSYMSPEQVRGESPTVQSDLYAWGLVCIECLTGHKAVQARSPHEAMALQCSPDPIELPRSIVNGTLRDLLARAVAKPLDERFGTADELMAALLAWRPSDLDIMRGAGMLDVDSEDTVRVSSADPHLASLIANHRLSQALTASDDEAHEAEEPTTSFSSAQAAALAAELPAPAAALSDVAPPRDDEPADWETAPATIAMAAMSAPAEPEPAAPRAPSRLGVWLVAVIALATIVAAVVLWG